MVFTAGKYSLEIEIFTLIRGFQAQISNSCAQKRRFQQSVCGLPGRIDFFNTIGRSLPVMATQLSAYREGLKSRILLKVGLPVGADTILTPDADFH